jgi:hypothetical protein
MEMQSYFKFQVSLNEPSPLNRVLEIIPWCLWGVDAVLTIFDPVFEGRPPLPVTALGLPTSQPW